MSSAVRVASFHAASIRAASVPVFFVIKWSCLCILTGAELLSPCDEFPASGRYRCLRANNNKVSETAPVATSCRWSVSSVGKSRPSFRCLPAMQMHSKKLRRAFRIFNCFLSLYIGFSSAFLQRLKCYPSSQCQRSMLYSYIRMWIGVESREKQLFN